GTEAHYWARLIRTIQTIRCDIERGDSRRRCCATDQEPIEMTLRSQAKTDLLQGTLDLLILQVVSLGPLHGYAIARRLTQISRDAIQVTQGSLYPALHRLERRGWLKAEWGAAETGREAKFYALTAKGRSRLAVEKMEWGRLSDAIALVLK